MQLVEGFKDEKEEPVLTIYPSDLKDQQRWLEIMLIFAELVQREQREVPELVVVS